MDPLSRPTQPSLASPEDESGNKARASIDPAFAAQLIDQTSHLSLSVVGQHQDSPDPGPSSPDFQLQESSQTTFMTPDADAQPYLRETRGGTGKGPETSPETVVAAEAYMVGDADGASPCSTGFLVEGKATAADEGNDLPNESAVDLIQCKREHVASLSDLPNEILHQILSYLDICDLLATSRISHHLRRLSVAPVLHSLRLRRTRASLSPLLHSPSRPSLAELIRRSIFLTHTTVVSRRLARSLVCIRLSRRLASRPTPEALVQRCVLPPECVPGGGKGIAPVAPALVARRRAIEKERVKDRLRRWVERVWRGEVEERSEGVKQWEEKAGVGRVWRLRRFWENVGRSNG